MRTLKVMGTGKMKLHPDMMKVTITLHGTYDEYGEALQHGAEDTDVLKNILKPFGFQNTDIKTVSFKIDEKYENYHDKNGTYHRKFIGYEYNHELKFEFDSDNERLGKILYAIARSNLDLQSKFNYTIKDPTKAKNQLLEKAVEDASEKAEILAKATGVNLKQIQSIRYSWGDLDFETNDLLSSFLGPVDEEYDEGDEEAEFSIDTEPDDIDASDNVTIIWEIE